MDRKLSWPAVSHICSLMLSPLTLTNLVPNSTPIVRSWSGLNLLSVNLSSRQLLPTPEWCELHGQHNNDIKANAVYPAYPISFFILKYGTTCRLRCTVKMCNNRGLCSIQPTAGSWTTAILQFHRYEFAQALHAQKPM